MKLFFLLPITLFLFTACQEPSKIEVEPLPTQQEKQPTEVIYEIPSGLIHVQLANYDDEVLALPKQVSISFEKQSPTREQLIVERLHQGIVGFLFSYQPKTLFFGCSDDTEETILPLKVDAARVVLCGRIKIPANGFEMRVTELELRDAELSTIALDEDGVDYSSSNMLTIYTANLTLTGVNKLILEGFTKGRERQRPPALFLNLAKVWGNGKMEIFSRSLIKIERLLK